MTVRLTLLTTGLTAALFGAPALAQTSMSDAPARAAEVEQLLTCRAIADDGERAACLDEAVDALASALDSGAVAFVDRRAVREIERDGFGLSLPSLSGLQGLFRARSSTPDGAPSGDAPSPHAGSSEVLSDGALAAYDEEGRLERITDAPVASVREGGSGILVTLENGQVWRQTDGTRFRVRPIRSHHLEAGLTATIERGLFGSFFMELSHDGRRFRAERVR